MPGLPSQSFMMFHGLVHHRSTSIDRSQTYSRDSGIDHPHMHGPLLRSIALLVFPLNCQNASTSLNTKLIPAARGLLQVCSFSGLIEWCGHSFGNQNIYI